MATFNWKQTIDGGACIACGTWTNDRGFVDFIGDTVVRGPDGDITGVVDILVCGSCLEQAARLVGCVGPQETTEWAYKEQEHLDKIDKLSDEVAAWQQRMFQLANLDLDDFTALKIIDTVGATKVIKAVEGQTPPPPPPSP